MTHSPYKYIGINKRGNKVVRTDLILLDGLSHCAEPVSTEALIEIADPRELADIGLKYAHALLLDLAAQDFVNFAEVRDCTGMRWTITEKGRAHLIANEARAIFEECARHTPVKPRIEEAPEPACGKTIAEQLRASHAALDADGVPRVSVCNAQEPSEDDEPAQALLCVDEDELDEWWNALDVEAKADAFMQWSLSNDGRNSHVYIEPRNPRIPLTGVVGDLSPETTEALLHVAKQAVQR